MRSSRSLAILAAWAVMSSLVASASPAAAVTRVSGDFYTYDLEMTLLGVSVSGTMTYEFKEVDAVSVGGTEYQVNVMSVYGSLSGGLPIFSIEVSAAIGGYVYETTKGLSVVRDELVYFANRTIGVADFALVTRNQTSVTSTYSPPVLSKFDPAGTGPGETWTETVMVMTNITSWEDGILQDGPRATFDNVTYSISTGSEMERVATGAGAFECLRITTVGGDGVTLVYWWSSEVGNFVKEQMSIEGYSEPLQTLTLSDYRHEDRVNMTLVIALGGAVLAIAVVVLVVVMMMRRRPPKPIAYEPTMPQPPSTGPPGPPYQ